LTSWRPAGKDDGIVGEADLVTAGWGTLCRSLLGGVHQTVWRNVRFLRHEIEGLKAEFVAQIEGREIEPKSALAMQMAGNKRRQRASPKTDEAREVARKLWPDGIPKDLANDRIVSAVLIHLNRKKDLPERSTILRAVGRKSRGRGT
jgi:hypothetical protein